MEFISKKIIYCFVFQDIKFLNSLGDNETTNNFVFSIYFLKIRCILVVL